MDPIETLEALGSAKGFKFVHLNVRSLPKKIDQIRIMLSDVNIDVITFSETWLKSYISTATVELDGYKSFRQDRGAAGRRRVKRGGGLITYVLDKHAPNSESLDDMSVSNEHIEAQWICIHRPNCKNVFVCNTYRPPSGDLKKAISYLDECLKTINIRKSEVFILGDMNVNYKNKRSPIFKKLNFFAQSNSLTQYISTTTRNTDKTNSLIDIVLTNSKFVSSSGTLEHFVSDHQPTYIVHKKSRDMRPKVEFTGRSYRNFNAEVFRNRLAAADWTEFYKSENTEQAWSLPQEHIIGILDIMCPVRTFRIKNYRPDWMTRELIEQIKDRDYFYKLAKKTGDEDMWNIAKHLRNVTNSHIRHAKRDFILGELRKNEDNAKKFWKVIRTVIPSKKSESNKEILLKDRGTKIDRLGVASFINDYFINVGNMSDTQTPYSTDGQSLSGEGGDEEPDPCSLRKVGELEVYRVIRNINVLRTGRYQ